MKHYETVCILNPDLADEEYQAALSKSREVIEKQKGIVVKVEEWGKQKLAYLVKKYDKGSYVVFNYCGDSGVSAELERTLGLDERYLKYMTVKLEEKADPEALLRQEQELKAGSAPSEEDTSETEQESETGNPATTEGEENG